MTTEKFPALRDAALKAFGAVLDDLATPAAPPPVVQPPGTAKLWPNAPGLPVLLDSDKLSDFEVRWNEKGLVTEAQDPTAPFSPPRVLSFRYPVGFPDGDAPGTPVRIFPSRVKHIYAGRWVRFSTGWQGHNGSAVNKIDYLMAEDQAKPPSLFAVMYGNPTGPYEIRMYPQFEQGDKSKVRPVPLRLDDYGKNAYLVNDWLISNVKKVRVVPGEWFRLETEIDASLPVSVTRWWLNGELIGHYLGLAYPASGFSQYNMAPVWGGANGDLKRQVDHVWFDHIYVQGR